MLSQMVRKRFFCYVEGGCCFRLSDAKLLFSKDGFRLGAGILERDNPYVRDLDPLPLGSEGEYVAHTPFVHAHAKPLRLLSM